jgi:hypothetical protein
MRFEWSPVFGLKIFTGFKEPEQKSLFILEKPSKKEGRTKKKITKK